MLANAWMEKNPDNDATRSDVIAGVEKQILEPEESVSLYV